MRRSSRRRFTKIDERAAAVGETHQHEAAAAEIAGEGMRDGQRKADRHRRVHGVAAGFQHRDANVGGEWLLRDDHALARKNRRPRIRRRNEQRRNQNEDKNSSSLNSSHGLK